MIICIFDSNKKFIGYKRDSFWNLSENPDHAKEHSGEHGIQPHLIENLSFILKSKPSVVANTLENLASRSNILLWCDQDLYIGYMESLVSSEIVYTHKIINKEITPIT